MAAAENIYSIYDFDPPVRRVIHLAARRVPGLSSESVSSEFLQSLSLAELEDLPQTGPARALTALLEIHRVMGTDNALLVPWVRIPEPAKSVLQKLLVGGSGMDPAAPSVRELRAVTLTDLVSVLGVGKQAGDVLDQITQCLRLAVDHLEFGSFGSGWLRPGAEASSDNGDRQGLESLIDDLSDEELSAPVNWKLISANTRWRIKTALSLKLIDTSRFPTSRELLDLTIGDLCAIPGIGELRADECLYELRKVVSQVSARGSLRGPVARDEYVPAVLADVFHNESTLACLASVSIDDYEFGKERPRFVRGAEQAISLREYLERTLPHRWSTTGTTATRFDLSEANWRKLESAAADPDSPLLLVHALLPIAAARRWTAERYSDKVGVDKLEMIRMVGLIPGDDLPAVQRRYIADFALASKLLTGATLQQLGDSMGTTRERARQRLARIGFGPKDARAFRLDVKRSIEERERQLRLTVEAFVRARPGSTVAEIADHLELPAERAQQAASSVAWLVLGNEDAEEEDVETLPSIIESRQRAIESIREASMYAHPLSYSSYDDLRREGRVDGLSAMRIIQLFDTWSQACEEAGVESGIIPNREYDTEYTRDEILELVGQYLCDPDFTGSSSRYDEWRAAVGGFGIPSYGTLRKHLGPSWPQIRSEVLRRLRDTWE